MDEDLRYVSVVDVSAAVPAGNGVEAGLVVLEEQGEPHRRIRMFIGQPEARAIRVAWRNEIPPRPSTWDLFVSTVALLGGAIESAVLTDVEDGRHYFAQLMIRLPGGGEPLAVTARPSDAIALVLRAPAALLMARGHVLDGIPASGAPAPATPGTPAGVPSPPGSTPVPGGGLRRHAAGGRKVAPGRKAVAGRKAGAEGRGAG